MIAERYGDAVRGVSMRRLPEDLARQAGHSVWLTASASLTGVTYATSACVSTSALFVGKRSEESYESSPGECGSGALIVHRLRRKGEAEPDVGVVTVTS
jgi:hypothetical protein